METVFKKLRDEVQHTFRSLEHRNFRAYFAGQVISLSGTWMQRVALSWLVYKMTKSPATLGLVDCAQLAPMLLFGLVGGSVADKFDRRRVLLLTQSLMMVQAIILATLTLTNRLEVWHAVALSFMLGTLSAFEVPSRQAFIVECVSKKVLVNAVSLNSSLFNGTRAVGPALAALAVTAFGEGVCFAANAVSFIAAIFAIASIKPEKEKLDQVSPGAPVYVKDALRFVASEPTVRRVLLLAVMFSIFGLQYTTLLPIFAAEILHGDVRTLGCLRGAAGLGAVVAALLLASRGKGEKLPKIVGNASLVFAVSLLAFAFSHNLYLSMFLLCFNGFGQTTQLSGGHSLVQLAVSDRLRGRVMSIYMMVVLGFAPIGSLLVGNLAGLIGAPQTEACCAAFCIMAGIIYSVKVRRQKHTAQPIVEPIIVSIQDG